MGCKISSEGNGRGERECVHYTIWVSEQVRETQVDDEHRTHANSNADAVVEAADGQLYFVEPYEISEPLSAFLDYIQEDSRCRSNDSGRRCVKYAQTRE